MAVTYSAKGTSVPYFTIGKNGTTIYQGSSDPSGTYTIKDGDLWIDTSTNSLKLRDTSVWDTPLMGNLNLSGNSITSATGVEVNTIDKGSQTGSNNADNGASITVDVANGGDSVDGIAGDGGSFIVDLGSAGTASGTGTNGAEGELVINTGDATNLLNMDSTGAVFTIDVSATDFINTSSKRYKKDVVDFTDTDNFNNIRPVFYRRKDTNREEIGFIAEEMVEQYPEIVHVNKNGDIDGIDYGKMSAILTAKVQQQDVIINSQQAAIDELSSKLEVMEEKLRAFVQL